MDDLGYPSKSFDNSPGFGFGPRANRHVGFGQQPYNEPPLMDDAAAMDENDQPRLGMYLLRQLLGRRGGRWQ